jgi:predicted helicase
MKALHVLAWTTIMAVVLFLGVGSSPSFAQRGTKLTAEEKAKLPKDVDPDTLSRLSLPKREMFDNDEEKAAWDDAFKKDPTLFDRFHATAHRLYLPVIADHYRDSLYWLRAKGPLEPRLKTLASMVATRETDNYIEYARQPKDISPEVIDVIKFRKDPSGLAEKDQAVIRLVREMVHEKKVSSKTYADAKRLFGDRGVMTIACFTVYYASNAMMFHLYDKQLVPGQPPPFPRD